MRRPQLLDFRPTQFVLGMKEIESKISKMRKFKKKELKAYCSDHTIPVVIGPKSELYIIDHHHFVRACWETNVDLYSIKVIKDLSHKNETLFWRFMIKNNWTYLNDQFGNGPHSPLALPADIRCLADDPFRSLVWAIIDSGLIKKDAIPFFEFQWAEFFRKNIKISLHSKSDFKTAILEAKKLAQSPSAQKLPGYVSLRSMLK